MQTVKQGLAAAGLAGAVLGLVVACGGGGGAGIAGIDRLGVTSGTISGFGSIIVGGVEYDTDQATFDVNDGPGTQADLKVGQQVTIRWESLDNGTTRKAQAVSHDTLLEGPVASIDTAAGTLLVLGQVVIVDGATSFDTAIVPRDLAGLGIGNVVEVSGLLDGAGSIRATRIDLSDDTNDFEVHGLIESLDTVSRTFIINGLTVDYAGAINPPVLANGQLVEVEGNAYAGGTLTATKVEIEDDHLAGADDGDDGEIEGYITAFVSATEFSVAGIAVTTNGQTVYEDGVAADLALNARVEVEGKVNSAGVLVARKVDFESDDDAATAEVEGDVTAVDTAAGTLAIAGVTITVTAQTRFEDHTGVAGQSFALADVAVGNYLEVHGVPGTGAALAAVVLERDTADDEGSLLGPASAIDAVAKTLSVLGVPVITDAGTQYRDKSDNVINAAAFFGAISTGSRVEVEFTQGGGTIVADELQLEDDD